ncbi:MAG: hypothetical protein WBN96_08000 [Gammaproteobacteria bacterium]
MTTNDKTRQKLVSSMRKTKVTANNKTTAAGPGVSNTASEVKPTVKKVNKVNKKAAAPGAGQVSVDSYQSGGRVWPD